MLDYDLSERGAVSLYEYLYQQIRDDILSGSIVAGEHLPSKRGLAQHLGISVITVEGAYDQLVAEGFVRSLPRRGYFANELPRAASASLLKDAGDRDVVGATGLPAAASVSKLADTDLEGARLWQRALKTVLATESERELFAPAPAQGTARLRCAIASHLRGSRGMDVDPDAIVIGAGAQLLDTMLVQLLGREKTYAVEDPGYLRLTRIYQACGCDVCHIPLDAEGPDLRELEKNGADVLHLMPSHQFPTGRVTSIARRYALLGWASQRPGRYLIEDDFDCEFRLAGKPIPPLAAIDAPGCVIYTNTFSKSLSSALRLAYMVLPDRLMEQYRQELGFYASTVSSIDQIVLAHLLETGGYERHVRRVRKRARDARDALVAAIAQADLEDRVRLEGADAGLHAVLAIKTDLDEHELLRVFGMPAGCVSALGDHLWCAEHGASDGLRRLVVQYLALEKESEGELAEKLRTIL